MEHFNDEHGEGFHQEIVGMERGYQGTWSTAMLVDFWTLRRDAVDLNFKGISTYLVQLYTFKMFNVNKYLTGLYVYWYAHNTWANQNMKLVSL